MLHVCPRRVSRKRRPHASDDTLPERQRLFKRQAPRHSARGSRRGCWRQELHSGRCHEDHAEIAGLPALEDNSIQAGSARRFTSNDGWVTEAFERLEADTQTTQSISWLRGSLGGRQDGWVTLFLGQLEDLVAERPSARSTTSTFEHPLRAEGRGAFRLAPRGQSVQPRGRPYFAEIGKKRTSVEKREEFAKEQAPSLSTLATASTHPVSPLCWSPHGGLSIETISRQELKFA